jgi:hypothetical protein
MDIAAVAFIFILGLIIFFGPSDEPVIKGGKNPPPKGPKPNYTPPPTAGRCVDVPRGQSKPPRPPVREECQKVTLAIYLDNKLKECDCPHCKNKE